MIKIILIYIAGVIIGILLYVFITWAYKDTPVHKIPLMRVFVRPHH
jgi:hypothetical protein